MNKYGVLASEHWKKTDPARFNVLEDPETFFEDLGEQVLTRVDAIATTLSSEEHAGESTLERIGRLNSIRLQAEEMAMSELVYIAPPMSAEDQDLTLPSQERVLELLQELQEREPEMSTEDFETEKARLEALQMR